MSAPAVAVSLDGKKLAAAWMDKRAGKEDLNVYWSISQGGGPAPDAPVHQETRGVQDHPALAIDSTGTVWVAWEDARSGASRIRARSSKPGAVELEVSEAAEGEAGFPALAAGAGLVAVVYEAKRDGEERAVLRLLQSPTETPPVR